MIPLRAYTTSTVSGRGGCAGRQAVAAHAEQGDDRDHEIAEDSHAGSEKGERDDRDVEADARCGRQCDLLDLFVADSVDLSAIASVGSATALVLFLVICAAANRLRANTGSSLVLILPAAAVTAIVLAAFSVDTLRNAPETFVAMILIGVVAIVFDAVWRARRPAGPDVGGLQDVGASGPA